MLASTSGRFSGPQTCPRQRYSRGPSHPCVCCRPQQQQQRCCDGSAHRRHLSGSGGSTSGSGRRSSVLARSSQREAAEEKQQLLKELQRAVATEDYAAAARIKAALHELELQDPMRTLQLALEAAVAEERYADAAQLRDQILQLEELNKPQPPDMGGLTTSSDTVTHGVRVKVRSFYVPAQSRPELGQYFFAYSVTVTNEGSRPVMLNSRHWVITDGTGKTDHVRGPGVVGEQPILAPGRSFEYQSACPLYTTFGCMEGEYEMVLLNEAGEWDGCVEVKIGRFALVKPEMA